MLQRNSVSDSKLINNDTTTKLIKQPQGHQKIQNEHL